MNAGREGDENANSRVVAEAIVLANSSYGYQIRDRRRHTVTDCRIHEKTHGAINNKTFNRLSFTNDQLYEVELVKSANEHKEPIIVGFLFYSLQK